MLPILVFGYRHEVRRLSGDATDGSISLPPEVSARLRKPVFWVVVGIQIALAVVAAVSSVVV